MRLALIVTAWIAVTDRVDMAASGAHPDAQPMEIGDFDGYRRCFGVGLLAV